MASQQQDGDRIHDREESAVETGRCPACHAATVITGHLEARRWEPATVLIPDHCKSRGISIVRGPGLRCCASCGLVWSAVDPGQLRELIKAHGDELTKLDAGIDSPEECNGLLNHPVAVEALRKVREVDRLVRMLQQGEATRRHREFTGGTWDTSVNLVRQWRDLTRDQKLAQFGWITKVSSKDGRLEPAVHPLHDRELDG